ncbi:MAG: hypothetical protein JXQ73_13405 [Phycisphaerae bacterium]|nr:hypothetical protein [Phycisphaerae bacterium]
MLLMHVALLVAALTHFVLAADPSKDQTFDLVSKTWTITVDPASMQVTSRRPGQPPIALSAGQSDLGTVTRLDVSVDVARWELPKRNVLVRMSVSGDELGVEIRSSKTGVFTWPVLRLAEPVEALIWPFAGGRYVPLDDEQWMSFLESHKWNTLDDLTMPFWGLYCGDCSITYIATNRYNNGIAFEGTGGGLRATFAHTFPASKKTWAYGLLIRLSDTPSPVEPARQFRQWLIDAGEFVPMSEKLKKTPKAKRLLGAAHVYLWGDGVSVKMLEQLKKAGLDRLRFCLSGWERVERRPEVARVADEMGYLFGTYDSFHSIHDPKLAGTDASWTTAQFGQELYETGGIEKQDGTKRGGFKQRGYLLSPHAARSAVEARVRRNMERVPYNYYFVDCDAYGQVFDDYSPLHPSTQQQDAAARVDRMMWIRDTFDVVIGSEGGSAYAAPAIHVSEGLLTPVIGGGDPDMQNRESEHYIGAWYPPDRPAKFFAPTPLKEWHRQRHYDARFRLPLNEIVYHDSFVSTHHWASSSLKFSNVLAETVLTEMLYQCPPLYHLTLEAFRKRRATIRRHYDFFSSVHRKVGFAAMTDFAWLSTDRLVQRTVFDDRVEVIANFGPSGWTRADLEVPARSVTARWCDSGRTLSFTADWRAGR